MFGQVHNSPTPNYVPDDDGGVSQAIQGIGSAIAQSGDAVGRFGKAMKQIEDRKDATTFAYLNKMYPKWRELQRAEGNTDAFLPDNTEKDLQDFLASENIDEAIRANLDEERSAKWVDSTTEEWRLANEVDQIKLEQAKELNGFLQYANLAAQESFTGLTFDRSNVEDYLSSLDSLILDMEESGVPITDTRWEAVKEMITKQIDANLGKVATMDDLKELGGEYDVGGRKYSVPAQLLSGVPKDKVNNQGVKILRKKVDAFANGKLPADRFELTNLDKQVKANGDVGLNAYWITTKLARGMEPFIRETSLKDLSYVVEALDPENPEGVFSGKYPDEGRFGFELLQSQWDKLPQNPPIMDQFKAFYEEAVAGHSPEVLTELWGKNAPNNVFKHLQTTIQSHLKQINDEGFLTVLADEDSTLEHNLYLIEQDPKHPENEGLALRIKMELEEKGAVGYNQGYKSGELVRLLQSKDAPVSDVASFVERWIGVNQALGVAEDSLRRMMSREDLDQPTRQALASIAIIEGGGYLTGGDYVDVLKAGRVTDWKAIGDPAAEGRLGREEFRNTRDHHLTYTYKAVKRSNIFGQNSDVADLLIRQIGDIAYYDHVTNGTPPEVAWGRAGGMLKRNYMTVSDGYSKGIADPGLVDIATNPDGATNKVIGIAEWLTPPKWVASALGFEKGPLQAVHSKIGGALHNTWLSSLTNIGTDGSLMGFGTQGETGNLQGFSNRDHDILMPRQIWRDERYSLLFALETDQQGLPSNPETLRRTIETSFLLLENGPEYDGPYADHRIPWADITIPGTDASITSKMTDEQRIEHNWRLLKTGDKYGNQVRKTLHWDKESKSLLLKYRLVDKKGNFQGWVQLDGKDMEIDMYPVVKDVFDRSPQGRLRHMGVDGFFSGLTGATTPQSLSTAVNPSQLR